MLKDEYISFFPFSENGGEPYIPKCDCGCPSDSSDDDDSDEEDMIQLEDPNGTNSCNMCNRWFSTIKGANVHQKKVHGVVRSNVCPVCRKTFAHRKNIKRHHAQKHQFSR